MENVNTQSKPQQDNKIKLQGSGAPYPVDTIDDVLLEADKIVAQHGSGKTITKDEIAIVLGKKVGTLNMFFSTIVQYGIFSLYHGKGYMPTELYRKYKNPAFIGVDEKKAKLSMFRNVPLYSKVIDKLNNQHLPSNEKGFANLLKDEPYKINPNSAERAAKVFYENARSLNLFDSNYVFKYSNDVTTQINGTTPIISDPALKDDDNKGNKPPQLFRLPIPLPGGERIAYLEYPRSTLNKRDIKVIAKALAFISSSALNESEAKEVEKIIEAQIEDDDLLG